MLIEIKGCVMCKKDNLWCVGLGVCFLLFVSLSAAKLMGFIFWSWWWVVAPLIPFGVVIAILIYFFASYRSKSGRVFSKCGVVMMGGKSCSGWSRGDSVDSGLLDSFVELGEKLSKAKIVVKHDAHVDAWIAYKNRPWTLGNYLACGLFGVMSFFSRINRFFK